MNMFQFLPVATLLLICICTGRDVQASIEFKKELLTIELSSEDKVCKPLPCTVINTTLRSAPTVGWYRADKIDINFELTGQWRHINSEYWQERLLYPTSVKCKEKDGEYDCSFQNDYYCRAEYLGLYQCRVTNTDNGTENEQTIRFQRKTDEGIEPEDCYMPMGVNLAIETEDLGNGSLSAFFTWNNTEKPRSRKRCDGSRKWQVRFQTFDNVEDIPEDHELVEARSSPWQNATGRNTWFTFTSGINRTVYYMFQVKNQDSNDEKRYQVFSSHVYYFGEQDAAHLTTESKTIVLKKDSSATILCEAEGIPPPKVWFLHRNPDESDPHKLSLTVVNRGDAKRYYCFASNTVVNPPEGKRSIPDIAVITVEVEEPDDSDIACDNYNDAICSPYIFEDVKVLVNRSKDTKDGIVRDATNAIKNLSEDPNSLSRCLQLAQAIVCHSVYPYCDSNALLNHRQALARPICNNTCETFTEGGECSGIIDPSSDLFALLMSNCEASGQVAGDSPECIYMSLEAPGKDGHEDIEVTGNCYTGNGRGYRGDITRTETGIQCQTWSSQHPHTHPMTEELFPMELGEGVGHACRNPQGLGERPWCYTTEESIRWQYCNVNKCDNCETYTGSFCEGISGFNTTHIHLDTQRLGGDQSHIELSILGFYHQVSTDFENGNKELTPGCDSALRLFLCHGSFPFCGPTGQQMKLCSDFCQLLSDMDACPGLREEIETYMSTKNSPLVEPDCELSAHKSCQPSPIMIVDSKDLPETEHCFHDVGHTYRGTVSVTETGIPCQRWDSDYPHPHNSKEDKYAELEGAENFCRNPGQWRTKPWCYTTNASVEWQYCDIATCNGIEPPAGNTTRGVTASHSSNTEDTLIGVVVTFAILTIAILALIVAIVVCYFYRSRSKRPGSGDDQTTLSLYSGGSAEKKLHYNPQYVTTIPFRLAAIIETFPQYDKSQIKYMKQLGQGNFGIVFQGKAEGIVEGEETIVAVKTLKEESSSEALENFVHEAKLMFSFNHPNIIKIHGVCMHDLPYYMIFEYMDKGDLVQFLRASASSLQKRFLNPFALRSRTESTLSNDSALLSSTQLIDICRQVSAGMAYLEEKKHVHRDLACRNCLLRSEQTGLTVKIGDFGMSQTLYTKDYYRVNGQAVLPVRWMSPEAVVYGKFSSAGDVWSFGIVMWEVFSFALQPYYGISNEEVTEAIRRGRTLQIPHDCPPKIYAIMKDCWNMDAAARPPFSELHQMLKDFRMSESSEEPGMAFDQMSHYSDTSSELSSDAFYEENSIDGLSMDVEA